VSDVRAFGLAQPIEPEFYLPLAQLDDVAWGWTSATLFIVARTDGDAAALGPGVRRAVASIDVGVPLFSIRTMEERMAGTLETARFNTMLLTMLGGIGLLLAAVGIYGVIAYFATQRTSEIGIRMALGATQSNVVLLVIRQAAAPVIAGVLIGIVGAVFASRLIAAQLVNVAITDPLTFTAVAAALLVIALLAALLPARRAAALDPTRALQAV
jgi:ABC-type antimicrobial peptide transport system permease subunit